MLPELATSLRSALGIQSKRDIQAAAGYFPSLRRGPWGIGEVRLGDDTAAIPDDQGHLLFAAEGMLPSLVASEPRLAGYFAVMVNASDIYAMGGRPLAIVDTLFSPGAAAAEPLFAGLADGARKFGVPVVGGHTNLKSPYAALSVAVMGRARRLLTSFAARPGDELVAAVDLRGEMHPGHPFWNASFSASTARLRADYELLPEIAEAELCAAAKDISMGGIAGTTLMLLEGSGVGATLTLDTVPRPDGVPWQTWLLAFPSFGFLLSVPPAQADAVVAKFAGRGIAAARIGRVDASRRLTLEADGESALLWDLGAQPLTGYGQAEKGTPA
jgi:AIR synthase-related protein